MPDEGINFKEYALKKFGEEGMKRFLNREVPFFERGREVVCLKKGMWNHLFLFDNYRDFLSTTQKIEELYQQRKLILFWNTHTGRANNTSYKKDCLG